MTQAGRETILEKLHQAPKKEIIHRKVLPPLKELSLTGDQLVERFIEEVSAQGGRVYEAGDLDQAVNQLTEIALSEGLKKVMISNDEIVRSLDLLTWGRENQVEVMSPGNFNDRKSFKSAVFEYADAGITGVDFAVAESGTLCLVHDKNHARLISLAPILHIAILPEERLYPIYEHVTQRVFNNKDKAPSHLTFITGPSMTADIQGIMFKGMHGPKQLIVILIKQK